MQVFSMLILEIFTSLGLSALVLVFLSRPLLAVLTDLCPTEKQALFWLAWSKAMFFLAPMLLVLLSGSFSDDQNLLINLRRALLAALAGLVIGMSILGKRVFEPAVIQQEREEKS